MKKALSITMACAALFGGYAAADPVSFEGLNYEIDKTLKTATVVTGEYSGDVFIPETISVEGVTYDVKVIGEKAFLQKAITSVVIPNSVDSIKTMAFSGCRSLTSVTMGRGLKYSGNGAFGASTKIATVNISDLSAWCGIEFYDFNANPIQFAKSITLNGKNITDLVIPDDVESIGDFAFYNCNSLQSITIGKGVKSIGQSAFYYCYNVPSLEVPGNVAEIGTGAFSSMRGIKEMTLGNGIEIIDTDAFKGCQALTSVSFPASLKKIGSTAFASCGALAEVNFAAAVDSIAKDAFSLSNKIVKVNIPSLDEWCKINFATTKSNPVSVSKSLFVNGQELTSIAVPEGLDKIKDYTFFGLANATDVVFPDGLKEIGNASFQLCQSIEELNIPETVIKIGKAAFQSCSALTSVNIPEGIDSISSNLFNMCAKLPSVKLPAKTVTIGDFAFSGCSELAEIEIPDGVTYVGNYAFQNCVLLERLVFPNLAEVKAGVCQGCTGLKYAEIQNPEKSIGYNAFDNCTMLEEVWLNTPFISYKQFNTMTVPTYYVPYGSVDTWKDECPNNTFKENSFIETDPKGYATYYIYADYVMPQNLEGCAIAGVWTRGDGVNKLVRGDVFKSGETVPYDTPLLIIGEANEYRMFEVVREHGDRFTGENMLRGSNIGDIIMKDDNKAYYMLGYDEYGQTYGFMPVLDNNAFEVPAHTAFLAIPAEGSSETGYEILFKGDDPDDDKNYDGIEDVASESANRVMDIYRLDGTKVNAASTDALAPGFYIINGNKIVVR